MIDSNCIILSGKKDNCVEQADKGREDKPGTGWAGGGWKYLQASPYWQKPFGREKVEKSNKIIKEETEKWNQWKNAKEERERERAGKKEEGRRRRWWTASSSYGADEVVTDGEGRRRGGRGEGLVPEGTGALVGEGQMVALASAGGVLQVFVAVIAVVLPHRHLDLPKPMDFYIIYLFIYFYF